MTAPTKIMIFGLALVAVFAAAYFFGGLFVSQEFVEAWKAGSPKH